MRRIRHGTEDRQIHEGKNDHPVRKDSQQTGACCSDAGRAGHQSPSPRLRHFRSVICPGTCGICSIAGEIANVINCAGLSPAMADGEKLIRVNAPGTVYVSQEFYSYMHEGSVIVGVSSNSAYTLPSIIIPKKAYELAETDEGAFVKKLLKLADIAKGDYNKAGFAYALSKNFVVWYAQKSAFVLGKKGIRVVSLSLGLIDTGMGQKEAEHGDFLLKTTVEGRMGKPEELGFAIACAADERNGYLAGVDILCDGGATNGEHFLK